MIVAQAILVICLQRSVLHYSSVLLCILIIPLYLLGMFRSQGVDIENYRRVYENLEKSSIVDPGFNYLMYFGNLIGLQLEGFLLVLGILNLFLIFKTSRFLNVNFGIVLAILALHMFVVRDFAQFRVGLAVQIVMFGLTFNSRLKYFIFALAGSIHFTALVLVALLISQELVKNSKSLIVKSVPFAGVILIGCFLGFFSQIDPRIELYMNWDRENYGQPVDNFSQLLFTLFLIGSSIMYRGEHRNLYMFSFIFSAVVFCSFASVAVFSFRLSNVALSLYPFFVAAFLRSQGNMPKKAGFLASLMLILSMRSGNEDIIDSIVLGFE